MAVLGGKSRPKLKNLKPFIKVILSHITTEAKQKNIFVQDSQIVQLVCKDSDQHESMVNELEDQSGEKNFFLADGGFAIYIISSLFLDVPFKNRSRKSTQKIEKM